MKYLILAGVLTGCVSQSEPTKVFVYPYAGGDKTPRGYYVPVLTDENLVAYEKIRSTYCIPVFDEESKTSHCLTQAESNKRWKVISELRKVTN